MDGPGLVSYIQVAKVGVSLLRDALPARDNEQAAPPKPPDASEDLRRLRGELGVAAASPAPQTTPAVSTSSPGLSL
jgi:hypothetical protein